MPQVLLKLNPEGQRRIPFTLRTELGQLLIAAVEAAFKIEGQNDAAFTPETVGDTINEAPGQIEVRYTAGKGAGKDGKDFDPPNEQKVDANKKIMEALASFWWRHDELAAFTPSIWINPLYLTVFTEGSDTWKPMPVPSSE